MKPNYKCPKCGGSNFKRWELPNPLIIHLIVNPGLAFNEIVLGQRIPKTQLICKECDLPEMDRSYIPCPSCKTMHLSRLASGKRRFGNWRGVRCPLCDEPIPHLRNIFSWGIIVLSFPLWALPYFYHFRKQPLPPLYLLKNGQPPKLKPATKKTWIFMGAFFAVAFFLINNLLAFVTQGEPPFGDFTLLQLPLYALSGLLFGFMMWFFTGRKPYKKVQGKQDIHSNI